MQMVLVFTKNIIISLWDNTEAPTLKRAGEALIVLGAILFVYVLAYLKSGFLGETEPKLDRLIRDGPYGFCRHPLYLSFIIIAFGLDLALGSVLGVAFTFLLSIPSVSYRARVEDRLLRERFGEEWEDYSERVGFILPKLVGGRE